MVILSINADESTKLNKFLFICHETIIIKYLIFLTHY